MMKTKMKFYLASQKCTLKNFDKKYNEALFYTHICIFFMITYV